MRVRLLRVGDRPGQVLVASSAGELRAVWKGEDDPVEGQDEDVELDVGRDPTWGADLFLAADEIAPSGFSSMLQATIEDYDDEVMTLRVGREGLLLVNPQGDAPAGADAGAGVVLVNPDLTLWPTNV